MKIFGRQVSIAVLIAFATSIISTVTGLVHLALSNWGKGDPASFVLLISGAVVTAVVAGIHTWDTATGQPAPVPVAATSPTAPATTPPA